MLERAMSHELLTLWFLRLNGYFCVPNFIIHPGAPGPQRTDADILAVRFPYCSEVAGAPMPQDQSFVLPHRIDFLIAEVKAGECRLNGPWAAPGKRNVQYVLGWMGFLPEAKVEAVAESLYQRKKWEDPQDQLSVRIACFGGSLSSTSGMREVLQRTHLQSVEFIVDRFQTFDTEKADHKQWDPFITKLFEMASKRIPTHQIMARIDGSA
jgi:hypothetical protein